jgi:tRNA (guanine-N7-)-methyltransferase
MSASVPVRSSQEGPDCRFPERMRRRQGRPYERPIAPHNRIVFEQLERWRAVQGLPLLLDSGCGTGQSSLRLADRFPGYAVLGLDKSLTRLRQRGIDSEHTVAASGRCCFALGDLVDLWRLMAAAGWHFERHYLFYPNPWPKPAQRVRRWPLHPIWPTVLALAPTLELRMNWRIYAEEALASLHAHGWTATLDELPPQPEPISPFEAKYQASGHALYRVMAGLRAEGSEEQLSQAVVADRR